MNKGFSSKVQNFKTKHKRAINSHMDWQSFYYYVGILALISRFLALYLAAYLVALQWKL